MNGRQGFFVVIDGPRGVGKSTVTALLSAQLAQRGLAVLATKEPSRSRLGELARTGTDTYGGLALACLVTADRYHQLEQEIRPALAAGCVVLCDRYVPSSLVLQQMDGVDASFLWQLNQHADTPDLTIILTGRPARSRARARRRGIYSRFHRGPATAGVIEQRLYRDTAMMLAALGHSVFVHDVQMTSAETVAGTLLDEILERLGGSG